MTQIIVLYSEDQTKTGAYSDVSDLQIQPKIIRCLNEPQKAFVKQHNWRTDFNWFTGETELSIRKRQFSSEEWCRILFLFPNARLRKGPLR